ncbi:ribonuclease kappa-A isoform X1 [Oryzias latipes]|uniref:Uncharacterized protein n=1 Tax=Oryzias latipes TaxID=8090 RepID=A0A3B3HAK2_ORYLA|nr:ribonuclease kappa-A isoform X1 [Oryzias latipes]
MLTIVKGSLCGEEQQNFELNVDQRNQCRLAQVLLFQSLNYQDLQALLGIFFITHSAGLIEDLPLQKEDLFPDPNPPQRVYDLYNQVGYNCFIAAAVYVAVGALSCCQMRLNKKKEYLVQ